MTSYLFLDKIDKIDIQRALPQLDYALGIAKGPFLAAIYSGPITTIKIVDVSNTLWEYARYCVREVVDVETLDHDIKYYLLTGENRETIHNNCKISSVLGRAIHTCSHPNPVNAGKMSQFDALKIYSDKGYDFKFYAVVRSMWSAHFLGLVNQLLEVDCLPPPFTEEELTASYTSIPAAELDPVEYDLYCKPYKEYKDE